MMQPNIADQRGAVQTPRIVNIKLGVSAILFLLGFIGIAIGSPTIRVISIIWVVFYTAVFIFALWVMFRSTRAPHPTPEPVQTDSRAPEASFQNVPTAVTEGMRVYPLHTGYTLVSFGQFFKGHDGWVGARAVWNMGADESYVFWAPVHAYLIDHPTHGLILVDAGISREQTEKGYYTPQKGGLAGLIWKAEDNHLPEGQDIPSQITKLGYQLEDIRHIIMTHLHEDHTGELNRLGAQATVYVTRKEWEDRARMNYAPSYAEVKNWQFIEFDSGCFYSFDASKDLFGDGSVILLPTYGHSFGHMSLVVPMDNTQVCLVGDALYTLRHLDADSLASFCYFGKGFNTLLDSARRLRQLQASLPQLVYVPSHDPFDYTFKLLHTYLEDGCFSETERDALQSYQKNLFDADGKLKPEAFPQFERTSATMGKVTTALP